MGGSSGLSFDDVLVKYIGEFGRHQKKVFLFASLFWLPNSLFILLMCFGGSLNCRPPSIAGSLGRSG